MIVEFGEDLAAHQIADRSGQRRAIGGVDQFEQIGDVGRVQWLDQFVNQPGFARFERSADAPDEMLFERVLLVEPVIHARNRGGVVGHFSALGEEFLGSHRGPV